VLALVCQLILELPPTGIEHGFSHPSSNQLLAAHIANSNLPVLAHEHGRKLVLRIPAPVSCLAMQSLGLSSVPAALGLSDLRFNEATAARLQPVAVAGSGSVLQAKVNAYRRARRR
jgi:hypothetical protein